jgi:hypothetical protein
MENWWNEKLTSSDKELFRMVEFLTEKPCEPKKSPNGYFIEADYSKHNDPDYINALYEAIEGRVGKRLIKIEDCPERNCLYVEIRFSEEKLPGLVSVSKIQAPSLEIGSKLTIRGYSEIYFMGVRRNNAERLIEFVGNGKMEIPSEGNAVFHFLNNSGSIWCDAPEGSFIVSLSNEIFSIKSGDRFVEFLHAVEEYAENGM